MPGDRAPLGRPDGGRAAPRELEEVGVYWLEEPLRCDDVEGYRRPAPAHGHPHRRGRDGARRARGARPGPARRRRRDAARRRVLRRHLGLPPTWPRSPICGRMVPRTPGRTATASSATCTSRSASPRARTSRCRSTRRPGRPSGATGCCRRPSRSRPTARSRRRPGPGSGSSPIWTRWSVAGRMTMRAAVLRETGDAARRGGHARAAGGRRGAGARGRGGRLPLRRAPGCRQPRAGPLADGARARGRRNRRGGRRGRGARRARRPRRLLHRPVLRLVRAVPGRPREPLRAGRRCGPRHADGRHVTPRAAGRPTLQHGLSVACFAERAVVAAAGVVPLDPAVPLWQAALLGCGAVTGIGAVRNVARPRIGESAAVIGCGGVGQQVVAGLVLAGAGAIVAVDRDPAKLRRARAAPPTPSTRRRRRWPRRARARRRRRRPRLRGRRPAGDDAARLGLPAAGGNAVVVGLAAVGVECLLPGSSSSPTRASRAATTAAATRPPRWREMIQMLMDGQIRTPAPCRSSQTWTGLRPPLSGCGVARASRTVVAVDQLGGRIWRASAVDAESRSPCSAWPVSVACLRGRALSPWRPWNGFSLETARGCSPTCSGCWAGLPRDPAVPRRAPDCGCGFVILYLHDAV